MANVRSAAILWKGAPMDLVGPELRSGDRAPSDFSVVANDMSAVKAADLAGKNRIVCSVVSLDTGVCDTEMRRFNVEAASIAGLAVQVVSMDLPFAQKRWCGAAGVDRVTAYSDFRERTFGPAWGTFAPAKGLLARAVFVVDAADTIRHVEYCKDATTEPNYAAALEAARALR
jgi:thiol peroxidase